jgi:hypothetical protein
MKRPYAKEFVPRDLNEITVDKDRFDAILSRFVTSAPLPLKDLTGTFPNVLPKDKRKKRKTSKAKKGYRRP